ncbi:MAG: ATPase [Campylobacterales bacterium]|nr:ATPase [Campylobacterales bacterium]
MLPKEFKQFSTLFKFGSIEKAIEFYAVFGGSNLELDDISIIDDTLSNILSNIHKMTIFDNITLTDDEFNFLIILANQDRREFSAISKSDLGQLKGKEIVSSLIDKNVILKEYSREEPLKKDKKHKLKKEDRRYHIQHKLIFQTQFLRFYFTFIAPFVNNFDLEIVINNIKLQLSKYIARTFENLSNELIQKISFDGLKVVESGGYWTKHVEIDILAKLQNKRIIVGECKWKNSKICKNILTELKRKCEISNIEASYFTLFSKSGFSKELINLKEKNLFLFDCDSFRGLIDD